MSFFKKKYRVAIVLLFAGLACDSVQAQDTPVADVATGYSLIVVTHGYSLTLMGGSASLAFHVNNWLGAVGEFGGYTVTSGSLSGLTGETYLFGPRFSYRHWPRLVPFGQAVLGGGHASSAQSGFTGATNSFAFGAGGGADVGLDKVGRFALRPQVEYVGFRGNGNTTGTIRVSVGIVFRIGHK
jgi:hypothetical protein